MAEAICPECGATGLEISLIDSEPNKEAAYIRRRFDCNACQERFSTYEVSLSPDVANRLDTLCREGQLTWNDLIQRI